MTIKIDALLSPFREILDTICGGAELPVVFRLILEKACGLVFAYHGSLMQIERETGTLLIACAVGEDWTEERLAIRLKVGEGITGTVASTGRAFLCGDTDKEAAYVALFPNVKSEIAVPVVIRGRVWAVINIDSEVCDAFSEDSLATLKIFAELVSFAIQLAEPEKPLAKAP